MSTISYRTKQSFLETLKPIKWVVIIFAIFILIGFVLGMIFGFSNMPKLCEDESFISNIINGKVSNLSSFIYRILSLGLISILLILLSKSKFLLPFALLLIFYRSYLLGINISIILSCYGISGIITALIYFTIELCLLVFLSIFYLTLMRGCSNVCNGNKTRFILTSILIILAINLLLYLILFLFSPKVIFVL